MSKGRKELWHVSVETEAGTLKSVVTSANLVDIIHKESVVTAKELLILRYILSIGFKLSKIRSMTIRHAGTE